MNTKQLREVGVPESCLSLAVEAIAQGAKSGAFADRKPQEVVADLLRAPEVYVGHRTFDKLARGLIEHEDEGVPEAERNVRYKQWGEDIDEGSKEQMREACRLPVSVAGAL